MPPSLDNKKFIVIAVLMFFILIGIGVLIGQNFSQNEPTPPQSQQPVQEEIKIDTDKTASMTEKNSAPPLGIEWIQDINTGIYLKNPEPTDGESITWSGGYVQEGQYKFADGHGVTNWYRHGELKQVDEGTFIKGERNGSFKHKFYPSGNVSYSDWDHGVEIISNVGRNDRWVYDFGMCSYYVITDSYIDHGDRGAEIDVKLLDQDGGAFIGVVHYSFNQTNDPRGFRFSTSSGQIGWMIEDRIAKPVFDYIAHYLHKGTS